MIWLYRCITLFNDDDQLDCTVDGSSRGLTQETDRLMDAVRLSGGWFPSHGSCDCTRRRPRQVCVGVSVCSCVSFVHMLRVGTTSSHCRPLRMSLQNRNRTIYQRPSAHASIYLPSIPIYIPLYSHHSFISSHSFIHSFIHFNQYIYLFIYLLIYLLYRFIKCYFIHSFISINKFNNLFICLSSYLLI